jgi:hypothetical protein
VGREAYEVAPARFWHSVAFMNFVQFDVGEPGERATAAMLRSNRSSASSSLPMGDRAGGADDGGAAPSNVPAPPIEATGVPNPLHLVEVQQVSPDECAEAASGIG